MFWSQIYMSILIIGYASLTLASSMLEWNPNKPDDLDLTKCYWMGTAPFCGYYCMDQKSFETKDPFYRYNEYYCEGQVMATNGNSAYTRDTKFGNNYGISCDWYCKILCCPQIPK